MTNTRSRTLGLILAIVGIAVLETAAFAQPPAGGGGAQAAAPPAQAGAPPARGGGAGGGRGGRGGGLPGATTEQTQAIADMNAVLAPLNEAVTASRNELAMATFAETKNVAGIRAAVDKLRAAELALATKRADEFAKLQAGPNKLNAEQVTALIAAGGSLQGGGRGGGGRGRGGLD